MIIVEQEKTYLVNFENVSNISLAVDREEIEYAILAQTTDKEEVVMGIYKTEERAKEVLQEIVKKYKATESLKISINRISDKVGAIGLENSLVYEMPEE